MTTLDLSHLPVGETDRTGQAVHTSVPVRPASPAASHSSLESEDGAERRGYRARRKREKREARRRGRVPIPPIPDLRYEEGLLLSLKPFIHRSGPLYADVAGDKGKGKEQAVENAAIVKGAAEDLFAGPVSIDWGPALWVVMRDQVRHELSCAVTLQVLSPLAQGALWLVGMRIATQTFRIVRGPSGRAGEAGPAKPLLSRIWQALTGRK